MTPRAQDEARLVLRILKSLLADRFDVHHEAAVRAVYFQIYAERDKNKTVLVLTEDAADFFHCSDDGVFLRANADSLAQWVNARKELLHQGVADDADAC